MTVLTSVTTLNLFGEPITRIYLPDGTEIPDIFRLTQVCQVGLTPTVNLELYASIEVRAKPPVKKRRRST